MDGIDDPDGQVSTARDLETVVAEFAPAIRLPDGGSFDVWVRRQRTNPELEHRSRLDPGDVVNSMVFVSQCQWGQRWLDASATGDQAGTAQAVNVLQGVSDWWQATGSGTGTGRARLLDRMRRGDRVGVQTIENGCGYTGSWGNTPAEQDAKALSGLSLATQAAQSYLRDGGDAAAFDPSTAAGLDPSISWTWSHFQPAPASPGFVFIAPSREDVLTLVSVSEAGTQFCAEVTETAIRPGETTDDLSTVESAVGQVNAGESKPVTCTS